MSQQINLFNPIFLKQKKYFSALAMAQALAAIGIMCVLLVAEAQRRTALFDRQAASTATQLEAKQARLAKVAADSAPRPKDKAIESEIAQAQLDLKAMQDVSAALARGDFGDTRGFSQYFRSLARQSISGLWLTEISVNAVGGEIGVRGRTLQANLVSSYIGRLATEPTLRGKAFSTLEISVPGAPAPATADSPPALTSVPPGAGASATGAPAASTRAPSRSYLEFSLQSTSQQRLDARGEERR